MSAIAGLWRFDHKPGVEDDCARMMRALEIYGPHHGQTWSSGALALGRRLYRTLPEDAHDRQPLQSRDGQSVLVADVRLDNRDELIRALDIASGEATGLCDAAILLQSLERWGERALDRLVGDFAFALWDAQAQRLLLARDFAGGRPLHYHRGRGFFAFASMPKGLHALPEIPYAPDEVTVAEFLTLMPQGGQSSFFKGIGRVGAGEIVTVTRDGLTRRHYWQPRRPDGTRQSLDDIVDGVRHHLDQATRSMLRGANGTVGTHLSGGFDSAAVTATAARLLAPDGGKVVAFTAVPRQGYDGTERRNRFNDEGPLAAATAALYPNIEHVLIRSGHRSPLEGLDRVFFLQERPVLNTCNWVWGQAIYDAARERKLGIMLSGQMGNMTLSYHGLEFLPELLRAGRLLRLRRVAAQLVAHSGMRWRGALVRTFGPFMPEWLWLWLNKTLRPEPWDATSHTAIRRDTLEEFDLAARATERDLDFTYRPRRDGFVMRTWVMGRADPGNGNKGVLAGCGIERRDPTSDKRLFEYCLSIPTEHFIAGGVPSALAKRVLADRLPPAVLNEQKKGYQAADWHEQLTAARGEVAAEIARIEDCAPATHVLDIERMKRLVENWPTGGWERDAVMRPYRLALLRGISAGHFLRKATRTNR